jgi:ribulose-5-phosphate 4-epimerase/fuculose-1-phosphate aldolase
VNDAFSAQRDEICRVGRSLFERGLVHATAGNISVRLEGDAGFLITPTDACLGFLDPASLAHTDAGGTPMQGARPSKTLALHRRIYAASPAARCVLHTHSTHLVALSLAGVWQPDCVLPPLTPYFVMKVGRVPLIPYQRPGAPEAAELVAAAIGRAPAIRAVLLDRLGPTVWHDSPATAMAVLEELEETARLWLMANARASSSNTPPPAPLTAARIDELRTAFGAVW